LLIGTRAKEALRRTAEWEKRTIGVSSLMPATLRRGLKRAIRKTLLPEARRFVAADKVQDLFRAFEARGTRYVVLRWFDGLPYSVDGDIDFLVADEALPDFEELLSHHRAGIPCDLYSESGVPGYRYGDIPYYPPELARRILERRTIREGSVSVPSAEDHFFSLAYHCLYQKGGDCGLPTSTPGVRPAAVPKHDYRGTLGSLADELGLTIDLNMEALDGLLAQRGWRPPREILDRLMIDNVWLRNRLRAAGSESPIADAPRVEVGGGVS
jgi:hypothetical protein